LYPIKLNTNTTSSFGIIIEYVPSKLVEALCVDPFTRTFAPFIPILSSAEVTFPEILIPWAFIMALIRTKSPRKYHLADLVCWFVNINFLIFNGYFKRNKKESNTCKLSIKLIAFVSLCIPSSGTSWGKYIVLKRYRNTKKGIKKS
jgi:hypothetical protein